MSPKPHASRGFTICMILLALIALLGVALIVYGSANNGLSVPRFHKNGLFAWLGGVLYG